MRINGIKFNTSNSFWDCTNCYEFGIGEETKKLWCMGFMNPIEELKIIKNKENPEKDCKYFRFSEAMEAFISLRLNEPKIKKPKIKTKNLMDI